MTLSCPSLQPNKLWERSSGLYKRRREFEASFHLSFFWVYSDILVSHFCATQIFHGRAPPLGRLGCRRRARKSFQRWRRRLPGVYPYLFISHWFICKHLRNLWHHHLYNRTGVSWVWLGRGKWERLARGPFTHYYLLFLILLHVN